MKNLGFIQKFIIVFILFFVSLILGYFSTEDYSPLLVGFIALFLGCYNLYQLNLSLKKLKSDFTTAEAKKPIETIVSPTNELELLSLQLGNLVKSQNDLLKHYSDISAQLMHAGEKAIVTAKDQERSIMQHEESSRDILHASSQILSSSNELVIAMNDVDVIAQDTSRLTQTGQMSLHKMEDLMRVLVATSKRIAGLLGQLNEKAEGIRFVIITMTKVADQTNLLSLNAALEAEKAKESGKGFAVIAKEIRRLADQTAHATLDIEKLVNDMITSVFTSVSSMDAFIEDIQYGVRESNTVGGLLSEILDKVQTFINKLSEVNHRIQSQSHSADRINESIQRLTFAAQESSTSIHELNMSIEVLNRMAQEFQ